ncbi:Rop [Nucleospora cyclopteri]
MNIKEILKKKIIKEVLTIYKADWTILIYDAVAGEIMIDLFTKSELNDYSIAEAFLINAQKPERDFPAIYFISGTNENYDLINKEFSINKFSKYQAIIIEIVDNPSRLNKLIKSTVIPCKIKPQEERIFTTEYENSIRTMQFLLESEFNIYKMPCLQKIPKFDTKKFNHEGDFLLLDRSFDLFTPLIHFLTFKSIISEIEGANGEFNENTKLCKEVRYRHLADINKILQYNINKLNQNMENLNKKLTTTELSKMVLDAPENIKLKESVEKYSNLLRDAFIKLDYLQEPISKDAIFNSLIESELSLVTGMKNGKKIKIDLSGIFDLLGSTRLMKTDKLRLLYLIKFKGVRLTLTERNILKQSGFDAEDIDLKIDLNNKYKREKELTFKYDISRFEPYIADIIKDCLLGDFRSFLIKANNLEVQNEEKEVFSLRKTSMLAVKKQSKSRKKIVVYIKNGLTIEECRLAYDLSEALGIELFLGSERILKPNQIIEIIKEKYKRKEPTEI